MSSADDLSKLDRPSSVQGVNDSTGEDAATATAEESESPALQVIRLLTTEKLQESNNENSPKKPFLTDNEIYTSLNTGRKKLKEEYGRLGDVVTALERSLEDKCEAQQATKNDKTLLRILQYMDTKDRPDKLRKDLEIFLSVLLGLSKKSDHPQEVKARIKSFVLFMLHHVFVFSKGMKKYKSVLTALGVQIPCDFDVEVAKRMLIAQLVGRQDMDSVVKSHWEMMRAKAVMLNFKSKHLYPLLRRFATDDFAAEEEALATCSLADEIAALTLTPTSSSSSAVAVAAVAAVASTIDENVGAPPAILPVATKAVSTDSDNHQDATIARPRTALERLRADVNSWTARSEDVLEAHKNGTVTVDDVLVHLREMKLALSQAASGSNHPSMMSVDTALSTDSSFDDRTHMRGNQISPLTIVTDDSDSHSTNNGFGSSGNGLSLTTKGVVRCLKAMDRKYVKDKIEMLANKSSLSDIERAIVEYATAPEPESDVERALVGSYWTLKHFEILRLLGGGAFGKVFSVRLVSNHHIRVVVKVECFTFDDFLTYFCRELVDGSKVKHKNIGKHLAFFHIPDIKHPLKPICMALVQEEGGDTLRKEAELLVGLDYRSKLYKVCAIVDEVLDGLVALERAGVSHRDIKPENIVRGKDSHLKLIDFGLAREVDDSSNMTTNAGTGLYIPPEGKGPKHDIYSTGVVFFELMVGTPPSKDLNSNHPKAVVEFKAETDKVGKRAYDLCANMTHGKETDRWTACRSSAEIKEILEDLS